MRTIEYLLNEILQLLKKHLPGGPVEYKSEKYQDGVVRKLGERYVYEKWIPFVKPTISKVDTIFDIVSNNFAIIAGGEYPNYFDVIEAALDDVNNTGNIDRLVIAIDSEELN